MNWGQIVITILIIGGIIILIAIILYILNLIGCNTLYIWLKKKHKFHISRTNIEANIQKLYIEESHIEKAVNVLKEAEGFYNNSFQVYNDVMGKLNDNIVAADSHISEALKKAEAIIKVSEEVIPEIETAESGGTIDTKKLKGVIKEITGSKDTVNLGSIADMEVREEITTKKPKKPGKKAQ